MNDWHATKLTGWVVNTIGKVILLAAALPLLGWLASSTTDDRAWLQLALVLTPFVVGGVLYVSSAPAPIDADVELDR